MKNTFLILLSFTFLLFVACQKDELIIPEGEYSIEEGYTMSFNDGDFQVHFDEVLYDARTSSSGDQFRELFGFRMITLKGDIEQSPHIFPNLSSTTLFYTPIGIYQFKLIRVTPTIQEINSGSNEGYRIYFTLTEV